jgi:hypothetical protein
MLKHRCDSGGTASASPNCSTIRSPAIGQNCLGPGEIGSGRYSWAIREHPTPGSSKLVEFADADADADADAALPATPESVAPRHGFLARAMSDSTAPIALVTGGASGIGQAVAGLLREAGHRVVVWVLKDADIACDFSDSDAVTAAMERTVREHGVPTRILTCAGVGASGLLLKQYAQQIPKSIMLLMISPLIRSR